MPVIRGGGTVSTTDVTAIVDAAWPNLDKDSTDDLTTSTTSIGVTTLSGANIYGNTLDTNQYVKSTTVSGYSLYSTTTISGANIYGSHNINASQLELTTPGSGLVLTDPAGSRWSLSVDVAGNLVIQNI